MTLPRGTQAVINGRTVGGKMELIQPARIVERSVSDVAPFLHRIHVIDMNGPMDMEVGVVTPGRIAGDARVQTAELPAGSYATLTYRNHARRASRALLEWAAEHNIEDGIVAGFLVRSGGGRVCTA
jgi:hypothetical protein